MTRTAASFDLDADVLARVKRLATAAGLTQRAWLERAVLRAVTGITVADYMRARVAGKADDAWRELTTEQQQMVDAYNAAVVPATVKSDPIGAYIRAMGAGRIVDEAIPAWDAMSDADRETVTAAITSIRQKPYTDCAPLAMAYVNALSARLNRRPSKAEVLASVPTADRRAAVALILDAMGYQP